MLKKTSWIVAAIYPAIVVFILIATSGSDQIIMSRGLPVILIIVFFFFFAFMWMFKKRT